MWPGPALDQVCSVTGLLLLGFYLSLAIPGHPGPLAQQAPRRNVHTKEHTHHGFPGMEGPREPPPALMPWKNLVDEKRRTWVTASTLTTHLGEAHHSQP